MNDDRGAHRPSHGHHFQETPGSVWTEVHRTALIALAHGQHHQRLADRMADVAIGDPVLARPIADNEPAMTLM